MEQETLFTASKWEILKLLADNSFSPIELAARSNTSVANISQQLRLLEMAGLVKSERISNRDKGQPRVLYSLAGNHSFLIATSNDFVQKKLFHLSDYNKIVMRIWFLNEPAAHYYLEKAFWTIEEELSRIDAIAVDETNLTTIFLFTRDTKLSPKPVTIKKDGVAKTVTFQTVNSDKLPKNFSEKSLYPLYDPGNIVASVKEVRE